jgi:pilus assembly protein CpaC
VRTESRGAAWALGLLVAAFGAPSRAAAEERRPLTLAVGEQRVLSSEGIQSFSEGVEGIVDVRLTRDGSQFVVVARRAGSTSLLLLRHDGGEVHYAIDVLDAGDAAAPVASGDGVGRVDARDNVRLDFYFVQLDEDDRTRVGVAWPAQVGGGSLSATFDLVGGHFTQATAAVTDQALPRLDMAQSSGWAKLLRQAAVITANGTEASFSGGGELNVPIEGALSASVRAIEFGSEIRVLSRYDRESGRIELRIHADVSDLASDRGTGVPGRVTSTLDTVVNLELGQSLVLAGLSARTESSSRSGLPALSQIPILGPLFGSHASHAEGSENVIFIVPTVVESISSRARETIGSALRIFRAYDGDLDGARLRRSAAAPEPPHEAAP